MLYGLQEGHSHPRIDIRMNYQWAHKSACIDYRFVDRYFLKVYVSGDEMKETRNDEWKS